MNPTTLSLLTREGVVTVVISPSISSDHYSELYDIVCAAETADKLRQEVRGACHRWGRDVSFE